MTFEAISRTAATIAARTGRPSHRVAVVLGSGLSSYAESLPGAIHVPYEEIPGFPVPRVEGHAGSLHSADLGGPVMILAGRVHTYEGWELAEVVFAVRTAVASGCTTVVLTNAAGGAGDGMTPGDLVLIRDHINLTGRSPLLGPNDDRLGPRFFQEPSGIPHRICFMGLIRQERHVTHDHGGLCSAAYHFRVIDHLVHRYRQRVRTTLHHVAKRVAHEDHVDPCLVHDLGRGEIVGREHGDLLAFGLFLVDIENSYFRHFFGPRQPRCRSLSADAAPLRRHGRLAPYI